MTQAITVQYFKSRYPSLYNLLDKKSADKYIELLLVEAYLRLDQAILGSRYYDAIRLTVASEVYKETTRSKVKPGTTGLETSRSVAGQYTVSYANNASSAAKDSLGRTLNEYETELEEIYRSVGLPFLVA